MQSDLQISYRGVEKSEALEAHIRDKVVGLEKFFSQLVSCKVIVERLHRHHHQGNIYQIIIWLGLPGEDVYVNREPEKNHAHEDIYVALRDAFDKAKRQLEERVRIMRGDVKRRSPFGEQGI